MSIFSLVETKDCLVPGSGKWDSNISMAQTLITSPFNRICSIVRSGWNLNGILVYTI